MLFTGRNLNDSNGQLPPTPMTPSISPARISADRESKSPAISYAQSETGDHVPQLNRDIFNRLMTNAVKKTKDFKWPDANAWPQDRAYVTQRVSEHFLREYALFLSFLPKKTAANAEIMTVIHYKHGLTQLLKHMFRHKLVSATYANHKAISISQDNVHLPAKCNTLNGDSFKKTPHHEGHDLTDATVIIPVCCGWKSAIQKTELSNALSDYSKAGVGKIVILLGQFNDFRKSPAELENIRPAAYQAWLDASDGNGNTHASLIEQARSQVNIETVTMDSWMQNQSYSDAMKDFTTIMNTDDHAINTMINDIQKHLRRSAEKTIKSTMAAAAAAAASLNMDIIAHEEKGPASFLPQKESSPSSSSRTSPSIKPIATHAKTNDLDVNPLDETTKEDKMVKKTSEFLIPVMVSLIGLVKEMLVKFPNITEEKILRSFNLDNAVRSVNASNMHEELTGMISGNLIRQHLESNLDTDTHTVGLLLSQEPDLLEQDSELQPDGSMQYRSSSRTSIQQELGQSAQLELNSVLNTPPAILLRSTSVPPTPNQVSREKLPTAANHPYSATPPPVSSMFFKPISQQQQAAAKIIHSPQPHKPQGMMPALRAGGSN